MLPGPEGSRRTGRVCRTLVHTAFRPGGPHLARDAADRGRVTRVLVVDDSAVMRRVLRTVIEETADLVVVGAACDGVEALGLLAEADPDVVVLDVEMPRMDGLAALGHLRGLRPWMPVVMFSSLTEQGASATLTALSRGAADFVTKPATGSIGDSLDRVRGELVPMLRALGATVRRPVPAEVAPAGEGGRPSTLPPGPAASHATSVITVTTTTRASAPAAALAGASLAPRRAAPGLPARAELVVVASSTGGPDALTRLLGALPAGFAAPILIAQHVPPIFSAQLADRLDRLSSLTVLEAEDGERPRPGHVYIAPGDHHLRVHSGSGVVRLLLDQEPKENFCRPSADPLFRTAAAAYGPRLLGLVLTGMGSDGLRGAEAVVGAGGRVIAQDAESSVVWGMPGAVVAAGLADTVLSLDAIPAALVGRVAARTA